MAHFDSVKILFIAYGLLQGFALLVFDLAVTVARHDGTGLLSVAAVAVLARTEILRCVDALPYLLGCHVAVMGSLVHVLVLLEVMDLLVLAVGCPDGLLAIANALLEEDTAWALNDRIIALNALVHLLEVMKLPHSLGLSDHCRVNILILTLKTLVRHICWSLFKQPHGELEKNLDILRKELRRSALSDLDDLALWV